MNIVVLLAGGVGQRMGAEIPKQHIIIENQQIIEYTLIAFSRSKSVDMILVVSNKEYLDKIEILKHRFKKLKHVIPGGETRIMSVYNAISFLSDRCSDFDKIIISDAARPCVRVNEIDKVFETLNSFIAVTTGVEVYETILKTKENEIIDIIHRDGVLRQTSPEGYIFKQLKRLYLEEHLSIIKTYQNIGIEQTKAFGEKVGIVRTSPLNFKITTPEDIFLFETVLSQGFDKFILCE